MYLKSIEIHGFKSFANRMKFDFHNGITAIVGPNGSGKSNVADAVRWVLGEQRIKQLRGASMQDVIFSGTETRKPLGYAFVAITLDNSDHSLAIDYDEVTVSRRLYRSGESEYMINGNSCRLKDVNELFYDTGIGKEGYSIIGQGQIDQILSSKPEDRRNLFDEAAGIVKFKLRKEAAIKKLADEKINLTRLNDILSELGKQIGPLEKQSEVAKIYLKDREQLRTLDVNMFLLDNEHLKEQLDDAEQRYRIAADDLTDTANKYEQAKEEYDRIAEVLETLDGEIETARTKMTDTSVMKEKLEGQIGILKEQIKSASGSDQHFQNRKAALCAEIEEKNSEKERVLAEKSKTDAELSDLTAKKDAATLALNEVMQTIHSLNDSIEEYKSTIIDNLNSRATIKSRQGSLKAMREQISIRRAELTSRLVRVQSDESRQEETIRQLKEEFEQINEVIRQLNDQQNQMEKSLTDVKTVLTDKDAKLRETQNLFHQEKSKLEAVANLTERYEGYGGSVKKVMERKEDEKGIIGVVADIIKTQPEYETAIEIALGGNIQNIVTDNEDTAKKMIGYLKTTKAGRATFLPLNSIKDPQEFKTPEVLKEKGVIGMADELVHTDAKYRDVAKAMLGRIVVVDHIDHAVKIARKFHYGIRMVTLEGELLVPGGAISGGAFKNNSNLLGRRREMEELSAHVKQYESDIAGLQKEIEETKSRRNEMRVALETAKTQLQNKFIEQNTARLNVVKEEERKKEAEGNFTDLKNENEDIENKLREIDEQEKEAAQALENSIQTENTCTEKIEELQNRLVLMQIKEQEENTRVSARELDTSRILQKQEFEQENLNRIDGEISSRQVDLDEILANMKANAEELSQKQKNIDAIRATIDSSANVQSDVKQELADKLQKKDELTASQKTFFKTREDLSERKSSLDKDVTRLGVQKEKFEGMIAAQINYMWDEYEVTLSDAAALRDPEMTNTASMKREITFLKEAIRKLGDVNVNAIEDYKNLMERYTFMKTQHDDLVTAEQQLREIIAELDTSMREQFTEQFKKINVEFDKVFKEMFGGGKGSLELVEEEDVLEAGIRIIAQPPGKKLQNMMQLSGGEKALTAIALLFAIQSLKPSPFCLLDEIEAALDENNVVRFAKYLHKLKYTQFIVITHRRGTMDSADRLYGITMQEKGVSALVSVNLIDKELTN
ncbi:MAG: chromosome segregation protein SMC [Butyrivibrio sp.]|nr:chromosome segregation protein SMC [Butyrivibrio sp.]